MGLEHMANPGLLFVVFAQKKVKQDKHCIKVVSEKWSDLVRKFVFSGYSIHNPLHPTALCVTCRTTLSALDKVN